METKGSILLVEDNTRLNTANRRVLELSGYTVAAAETVTAAWEHLNRQEPDIILLDVMLPDGDGVDFCREIRKQSKAHIIYLTAKTEYEDLSRGLEAGGDDYIRKPFHPQELLDRINAAMRRQIMENKMAVRTITCGPLTLDAEANIAYLSNKDMLLSQKEFTLLKLLVQNEGRTQDKETIFRVVWGQPLADNSRSLYTMVSRLKKKLEPYKKMIILNAVRGDGYRLKVHRS